MTIETENEAIKYLINEYSSNEVRFEKSNQKKYDLWIIRGKKRIKGELKASKGSYKSNTDISKNMIFNTKDEKILFETGKTEIVRVFLADTPPTVIIVNNKVLNKGASLKRDHRYILKGRRNYGSDAISNISCSNKAV